MEPFLRIKAAAVPFRAANIDTDQIIPARFLSRPRDQDYGPLLFHDLRWREGVEVAGFPLNQPGWRGARIVLGGANFACGSSRENAVWAFYDYGVRVVIAPSYGDIFANNAVKNGMLAVVLPAEAVAHLMAEAEAAPGALVSVDLPAQSVVAADGTAWHFEIEPYAKKSLLEGLDELAFTMSHMDDILAYEARLGRDNR